MRFAQIVHDLFEVFTKKPQNPLDLAYCLITRKKAKFLSFRSHVLCIPWTLFACNAIETDLLEADGTANSPVTVGEKVWEAVSFRGNFFWTEYEKRAKSGATGPIVRGHMSEKVGG